MQKGCDVILDAQWQAVSREARLAAEQAAYGVTVLGRANHAQTGLYSRWREIRIGPNSQS